MAGIGNKISTFTKTSNLKTRDFTNFCAQWFYSRDPDIPPGSRLKSSFQGEKSK